MSRLSRREFLKRSAAVAGAALIIGSPRFSPRAYAANETVHVGVAGLNGRGSAHVGAYAGMADAQVTYLIDPDKKTYGKYLKRLEEKGGKPVCVQDIRKALEDKDLDAVSVATCNHWHCLITIWACQAGKDVYVEKPLSQNVHEGRIAYETARKFKRVVQYGTGSGGTGDGIVPLVKEGTYGKLLVSRGLCYKGRASIGFKEPADPPPELDFDIWNGPAPKQPYHANLVHYNWHWFWDFGNGDIGNQGAHQMHGALHAIAGATLPKRIISVGGRFGYKDQGQTANTQIAVFDFGETQLMFEVRGLKTGRYFDQGVGNTFHFEKGVVAGGKFYPNGGKDAEPVTKVAAKADRVSHGADFGGFIRCVKSRDGGTIDNYLWNIETAHYSSALIHLANISYRLGKDVPFGTNAKPFGDNPAANETFDRMRDHLKENNVPLEGTTCRVGRTLQFDAKAEKFIGDPEADKMLTRPPRKPFDVPETA